MSENRTRFRLDQRRAPIYEALEQFRQMRVVPFDVPGHKRGRGNPELTAFLGQQCVGVDVNSMKPLDNLCHPVSVIREAEELAADAFGAAHAFLMVGGTTSSVQSMVLTVCKRGDEIILPRNVHRSVLNALVLCGAVPVYVNPEVDKRLGISLGMKREQVAKAIKEHPNAVAVLVNNGGFTEALTTLSLIPAEGSEMAGPFVSFFGPNLPDLLGVIVLTSLGTWGLPQMVQKFYAIKTGPAIKQGAIISTIFAFVVAGGSYFLGGFGRLYEGQIEYAANGTPIYDSIIPTMLSTLPDVLIGLVIVLVLSASMSTLSSLVLTSSSTLTIDFINGNIIKNMSEKKQLVWMRGLLVVFIAISALIALFQYHSSVVFIAQLMGYSWGALAGSFLGPFLWGLYSGRISKASVWCSFAVGVGLTAVNMGLALSGGTPLIASPINCGALCMILSLVIVPVVSLFTPAVPFQIKPPTPESAIDREYDRELAQEELESATVSAAADV